VSFDARLTIVALATFALANGIVSLAVWRLWPRLEMSSSPVMRAAALLQLRLTPSVLAAAATMLALFAFVEYEPRGNGEHMGIFLVILSSAAASLMALSATRGLIGQIRTARLVRAWGRSAERVVLPQLPGVPAIDVPSFAIDTPFPIVAVVGLVRPRLFIARVVLASCTPEELQAILRHERGHITRRDNLRHLVFLSAPDCLAGTPFGARARQMWRDATEEAADDAAAPDAATRLHLAAALVRVARLVPAGCVQAELPMSALYRGEPLETRVRRLLDTAPPPRHTRWRVWHAVALVLLLGIGLASADAIQNLVEAAVKFLP
jgi:Zn-dependent protease with chaperone function